MPRKKTIQPDPIESYTLEDGTIVEHRDETCQEIGKGLHKRNEYEAIRDAVLESIYPIYIDKNGRKIIRSRSPDPLKYAAVFERWYTRQGFPERNETEIRKRLYKDIKKQIKYLIDAVEAFEG